jgi:hypothetical protein
MARGSNNITVRLRKWGNQWMAGRRRGPASKSRMFPNLHFLYRIPILLLGR